MLDGEIKGDTVGAKLLGTAFGTVALGANFRDTVGAKFLAPFGTVTPSDTVGAKIAFCPDLSSPRR